MDTSDDRALALGRSLSRRSLLKGMATAGAFAALARVAPAATRFASPGGVAAYNPVRFAMLGDWGNGDDISYGIAGQMAQTHQKSALDMVVTAGDNIYPDGAAKRFASAFEQPFAELIKKNVPFYASLGNHDVREGAAAQANYPLFNMKGQNYYSIPAGNGTMEVFVLDSNMMDTKQIAWADNALARSTAVWKVVVFHHPLYSSGRTHGADDSLRRTLEPMLVQRGVQVVVSGHDHLYQRVTPQQGIQYFVSGAGGKIREGDLKRDQYVAAGYDQDGHFMVFDVDATKFGFKAVNSRGETVDSGELVAAATKSAAA